MAFELPEGFIKVEPGVTTGGYNLPPGFVREPRPEPADTDPTFIDGIGTAWDKRKKAILESREDYATGEIGFGEGSVQTAGQYAGFAADVIGEGIVHTFQNIGDGLEYAFPEAYEGAADGIKSATNWVMKSEAGQAASEAFGKGYASYSKWKKENPQDAKTFESVVNVAILFSPYKTKINANPAPSFGRKQHFGTGLKEKGLAKRAKDKNSKVQDMLFPEKLDVDTVSRVKQVGWNKRSVIQPKPHEIEMIKNVGNIKGIRYARGDQYNYNTIMKHNEDLAIKLQKDLDAVVNISVPNSFVFRNLDDDIVKHITNNTDIVNDKKLMNFLVGNGKTDTGYLGLMKKIISEHPQTPAGLLDARKAFDAKLKKMGVGLEFNAYRESAKSVAAKTIRRTVNQSIHDAVPDKAVKESLAKQASLWRATDMLQPKVIASAKDTLGRVWQGLSRVLDLKMGANRAFAIVGGISAVGASYAILPAFVGGLSIAGVGILATKGINSGATKMAFGKILALIDKGIKQSRNGDMIKQLRADRIIVQDLFEMPVEKETKTEK